MLQGLQPLFVRLHHIDLHKFASKQSTSNMEMTNKERLKILQREFSEAYTLREYISTTLTNSVFAKYLSIVGRGTLEKFKLNIELKQLKMKVKLALQYVNQGLSIDYDIINQKLQDIADAHQAQVMNTQHNYRGCIKLSTSTTAS